MQFKVDKLLFFDIESVSQYKDLFDMPDRQLFKTMNMYV